MPGFSLQNLNNYNSFNIGKPIIIIIIIIQSILLIYFLSPPSFIRSPPLLLDILLITFNKINDIVSKIGNIHFIHVNL